MRQWSYPVYNACISVVFSFLLRPSSFLREASGLFAAAFAALVCRHCLSVHRAELRLVGEHLSGVLALLALVADELDADGLHVAGGELLLAQCALCGDAEVEGAQSVELDLVALQEQFLEAHDESLNNALHHIRGEDRTVLHDVTAEVICVQRVHEHQPTVGLAVSGALLVSVLVLYNSQFCHNFVCLMG